MLNVPCGIVDLSLAPTTAVGDSLTHILEEIGFKDIITDKTFGDRIFVERDEFYIPDKMFSIKAIK